jgi:putative transposase
MPQNGGFSDPTFYKWRAKYDRMDVPDVRRLLELEGENAKRKAIGTLVTEQHLSEHRAAAMLGSPAIATASHPRSSR